MSLTLKNYQQDALTALGDFFARARHASDEAGLDQAFRAALAAQDIPLAQIPPYLGQGFASSSGSVPYVCIRIPTGGGKTLLGTHALALAWREYAEARSTLARPVALWLVPSNMIRTQTLNALRQPGHPYREALEGHFGVDGFRVIDIAGADQLRPQDFGQKALIVVGTLQTLRVDDTSGRDVYAYKEAFEPHFERAPDLPGFDRVSERDLEAQPYLTRADLGKIKRSFANLMYWHRPLVIVDEAHNARTALTYDTFARLNPAALVEMTATPIRKGEHRSNVLYHVSAEELKAEQMIKLPIVLQAHPNWQEAVRDALLTRKRLAEEAVNEVDYLRPILLLQAEDKAGDVTVDVLKQHLLTQEHIAAERIAIATGNQRELDGLNLFDPTCPVDIVITIEALKEGWDCSFAYVFCSLQKIGSSRDMEQLLGRVLRMPYARARKSPLLNRAYAHLASAQTARVANELADRLVAMGFEELEAAQAVFPSSLPLFDDAGTSRLPIEALELNLPVTPGFAADLVGDLLPGSLRLGNQELSGISLTSRPEGGVTVRLETPPSAALRAALVASVSDRKIRDTLDKELTRFTLRHQAVLAPSARGVQFAAIPLLCVRDAQGELELAEKEVFLDLAGFSLAEASPALPAFSLNEDKKPYLLDIADGHLRIEQERGEYAVNLDLIASEITETDLLRWLDERLRGADTTQIERLGWLARVLHWLQREGGHTLTGLYRHRSQLCEVLLERLRALAASGRQRGFQLSFLDDDPRSGISADYRFHFQPGAYPARPPYYQGRFVFARHYYGVIGDLYDPPPRQTDHEIFCADAIDKLPEVRHWVRNLPKNPEFSFWLPVPDGRFYPDFVAELNDGRILVVEYKGEGYKSNDDSVIKRRIGETWAGVSGNLFLFAVERDADGRDVAGQLRHLLGPIRFAEHTPVLLKNSLESDGYVLAAGQSGTVVAVYGGGQAYAVEFLDIDGEMAVVTIAATDLVQVLA
jgi:type III restriction enzyme